MSIKIENVVLPSDLQWKSIIMGTRNPMNSWDKSDSTPDAIGEKDLKLLSGLAKAGPDHGKFLRMIPVYIDITAPLYWWKEFDTYKIGTVANSCSTMHKIHDKEFTLDDFSHEHLSRYVYDTGSDIAPVFDSERYLEFIVEWLNLARDLYLKTKDKNDKNTIIKKFNDIIKTLNSQSAFSKEYQKYKNEIAKQSQTNNPFDLITLRFTHFQNLFLEMNQKLDKLKHLTTKSKIDELIIVHSNLVTIKEEMK